MVKLDIGRLTPTLQSHKGNPGHRDQRGPQRGVARRGGGWAGC